MCAALVAGARAETSATITPSLLPDRLGAEGELVFTIDFAGGESNVPTAVRRSVVQLPAGMGIEIPVLRSCAIARLRAHGPNGCPAQSEIGRGHALAEVRAGSQTITENISLWLFLGPFQNNLQPTFEILGQGYTPFDERVVLTGTVLTGRAPYGEELALSIPPIPTLPLEPDASIVSLSLTIGTGAARRTQDAPTVVMPSGCPFGGFPFAAEFTYADGSTGSAVATSPCPA